MKDEEKRKEQLMSELTQLRKRVAELEALEGKCEEDLKKCRENSEKIIKKRTAKLDKRISEVKQLNNAILNLLDDHRISNESLEDKTQRLFLANKELDAFAFSVSHDLRIPLRAIDGFSKMLFEDYGDKLCADGLRKLNVIQNSAKDMGRLINDLLAFSRLGRKAMSMSDINMGQLAEEVFEQLRLNASGQAVRLNIQALPPGYGDRSLIREVFGNLISNAIKFSRPSEVAVVELSGKTEGKEILYSVKDNGVGFDMKYADKLFQVFQRLHSTEEFEGTGVGLALVQRIIHRHGGRVWAEGKLNEGAIFYFTLPRGK